MKNTLTEKSVPRDGETIRRTSAPPPKKPTGYVTDLLRQFLLEEVRITTRPIGDLTTNELLEVLAAYCECYGYRMPSARIIRRFLPSMVWEVYGVAKSHSIRRDGKFCRGYRRLEWRPCENTDQFDSTPQHDCLVPGATI